MTTSGGPGGEFRYWAFISYSSKDAAVARKLHRALEMYSIPRDLRGRPGRDGLVPAKLFPIFRDRDELPLASDLGSTITDVLKGSAYLIVLCSPNSAKSKWVDAEVRNFKAMGKADRIIAFILDGEPNGSEVPGKEHLECFPPSLKVRVNADGTLTDEASEPIGGDLRKGGDGWKVAFLKAVAGITGLGFDAFARREKKRQRVKKAVCACLALILMAGGVGWWDYTRVKVAYFQQVILNRGVPVGLVPITDDEAGKAEVSYAIESSRRKVRSISAMNSSGVPITLSVPEMAYPPETSKILIEYRENGGVAAHLIKNVSGTEILRHVYSEDQTVVEFRNPRHNTVTSLAGEDTSLGIRRGLGGSPEAGDQRSEIARWRFRYDGDGWPVERRNENAWGVPIADAEGCYGVRYLRGQGGQELQETSLDADGNPTAGRAGAVAGRRNEFDAKGRVVCVRLLDVSGNPTEGPSGAAIIRSTLDAVGNVIERRYCDASDRLTALRDGIAIERSEHDGAGRAVRVRFFSVEDKPVASLTYGCHEVRTRYDGRGGIAGEEYYDAEDGPGTQNDGVHSRTMERDSYGRMTAVSSFGTDGKPVAGAGTLIHRTTTAYDESGNVVEIACWGTAGEPVADEDFVHRRISLHDGEGRLKGTRTFGADNQPCLSKSGYHESEFRYDQRGNIVQRLYFGTDRKPVLTEQGFHVIRQNYDERGLLVEEFYLGVSDEPVVRKDWPIHGMTYRYNERGELIERRFRGTSGQPADEPKEGYQVGRYGRDGQGNAASEAYFDTAGKPVVRRSDGVHMVEREFDKRGHVVSERYFDNGGRKMVNPLGFHRLGRQLDAAGNTVLEEVFGTDDKPVSRLDTGIHAVKTVFNPRGLMVERAYYDPAGGPTIPRDKFYHLVRYDYDGHGQLSQCAYFMAISGEAEGTTDDPDIARNMAGEPGLRYRLRPVAGQESGVAVEKPVYDSGGRLLATGFFGVKGQPVIAGNLGYHRREMTLDAAGRVVEMRLFGTDGGPMDDASGVQCFRTAYDARGNIISRSYFDREGRAVVNGAVGAHRLENKYDERGNQTEESAFGTGGMPVLGKQGVHRTVDTYDASGHRLEQRYYGMAGERVLVPAAGVHAMVSSYDGAGNETAMWMLGLDDEPVLSKDGYHRVELQYNERGKCVSTAFFGTKREPIVRPGKRYHAERTKFNERNQLVDQRYEDAGGRLVAGPAGYAITKAAYDARGNMCEILYFGPDGKPVLFHGGARWVRSYDPVTNQPLETILYDLDGKRVD